MNNIETHWVLLIVAILFAFGTTFMLLPRKSRLTMTQEKSAGFFRENIIAKKVEQITHEKVRASRVMELETLAMQAGFHMKYAEIVFISLATSVGIGLVTTLLSNNPLLGIVVGGGAFFTPKQLLVFLRNRRVEKMGEQVGPFMNMVITRYKVLDDFGEAIKASTVEFRGEEPLYTELKRTVNDITVAGGSVGKAFEMLGVRTGNKYLQRLADYYRITSEASEGSNAEKRVDLMSQAYRQYHENERTKAMLKKELSTVKRDSFIMLGAIPGVAAFQAAVNPDFIPFITTDPIGKVGITVITMIFFGSIWFINNKISAPIE